MDAEPARLAATTIRQVENRPAMICKFLEGCTTTDRAIDICAKKSGFYRPLFLFSELNFAEDQCSIGPAKTKRIFNRKIDWHLSGSIRAEIEITLRILIEDINCWW